MTPIPRQEPSAPKGKPRPALFRALGTMDPPPEIYIDGQSYSRVDIFKHDSWAATALYRGDKAQVVCKFNRRQAVLGLSMGWLGRFLARREAIFLRRLAVLENIPALLGMVRVAGQPLDNAVAHPFVAGHPLGSHERVADDFFPSLKRLLAEIHGRGIAYMDLHKRENILVGEDGQPYLIDFQVCFTLPPRLLAAFPPLRHLLRMLQQADRYHLVKHEVALRPDQCAWAKEQLDEVRPWWIKVHRLFAVPLRIWRRKLLVLCGIRKGAGKACTEIDPEDAVRRELVSSQGRAA